MLKSQKKHFKNNIKLTKQIKFFIQEIIQSQSTSESPHSRHPSASSSLSSHSRHPSSSSFGESSLPGSSLQGSSPGVSRKELICKYCQIRFQVQLIYIFGVIPALSLVSEVKGLVVLQFSCLVVQVYRCIFSGVYFAE